LIRVFMLGVAVAVGSLMVLVYAGLPAQASPDVIGACGKDKAVIDASGLPATFETDKCLVGDRPIVDGGVGSVLPPAGEGVYAEALTTSGSEDLLIVHQKDGTVNVDQPGSAMIRPPPRATIRRNPRAMRAATAPTPTLDTV